MSPYEAAMSGLLAGRDLSQAEAAAVMGQAMEGRLNLAQTSALLTALAVKGESVGELTAFARTMRACGGRVETRGRVLDTCGTGGSGMPTVNTSTMVAFVAAAAGVKVAKHGNRASSGKCGSSDLLESLGIELELGALEAQSMLQEVGLALLFAPLYHPAVRHVVPARKALGFRTVFNFLGPLCNPAGATHQMLGVSDLAKAPKMAEVLGALGCERALLVRGEDGLDEITLCGPTKLWELRGGVVKSSIFDPRDMGVELVPFAEIAGGSVSQNVRVFREVIAGVDRGPRLTHLAINAGAAIYVAGEAGSISEGYARARGLVTSGRVMALYESYKRATALVREAA